MCWRPIRMRTRSLRAERRWRKCIVLAGSTASEIVVGAGAVGTFSVGDMIAVDADYAAAEWDMWAPGSRRRMSSDPVAVNRDANYIRRVTFNLGRVVEKTTTALVLGQALLGGAPAAGMGVQKVMAFVDREGGSFFQEWSALFVAEEEAGGRICFHYPRLSPTTSIQTSMRLSLSAPTQTGAVKVFQREEDVEILKPISAVALRAAFRRIAA